jgi:DNA-binding transcriptional LysR family regulator
MDRLRAMAVFRAVEREGGFAAAARSLGMSPPAVTRAIADLEDHLGIALFYRSTRKVALTEDGAAYLKDAGHILDLVDAAERQAAGSRGAIRGELKITAPVRFGELHILPVVNRMLAEYPELSVRLLLLDRNVQLEEEGIDVAVRIGVLPDSAFKSVQIAEVRQVVVASPEYLERCGGPAEPEDIPGHATILTTTVGHRTFWRFGSGRNKRIEIRPRLSVNSIAAVVAAARTGLGIASLYDYQVAGALEEGALVTLLDHHRPPPVPVQLLFAADRAHLPAVRAFIEAAKEIRSPGG